MAGVKTIDFESPHFSGDKGSTPMSRTDMSSFFQTPKDKRNDRQEESEESEDDSEGNPKTLMRVLTRFADRTSMQGVPYINVSKVWYAKLAWTLLFCIGFAAMCFHLYYLIQEYYTYKTHSVVTLGFNTLAFPAVTLCNVNPIKTSKLGMASQPLRSLVESVKPSKIVEGMEKKREDDLGGGGDAMNLPPDPGNTSNQNAPSDTNTNGQNTPSETNTQNTPSDTNTNNQNTPSDTNTNGQNTPSETNTQNTPSERNSQKTPSDINTNGQNTRLDSNTLSSGSRTDNQSDVVVPEKETVLSRRRRFVEGFSISETNTRYKPPEDDDPNRPSGNKSTLRMIEDEFKYLYSIIERNTREAMGHQIDDMLMECTFRGIQCDDKNFELVQTAEYGNCYTIDSPRFVSVLGGPGDGLDLIFFIQDEEYLHGITNSLGFQVQIHPSGSMANPYEEGISIPAGMESFIGLKQVNIERLDDPFGACEEGKEFENNYGLIYTQKTCQQFCIQKKIIDQCHCFDTEREEIFRKINRHDDSIDNSTRPCKSDSENDCLNGEYLKIQNGTEVCSCLSPCDETMFTKSISSKQWPTSEYAQILVEYLCGALNETECQLYAKKSRSELASSFLKIVIYFEDLNYENITEEENYELFQFVSDIGGTIGLWIGLSLISFFEVLQFVYELFHYVIYVKPRQKKKLAKKMKRRRQQQSVRHAIRFANNISSSVPTPTLHTDHSKLSPARLVKKYELPPSLHSFEDSQTPTPNGSTSTSSHGDYRAHSHKPPAFDDVMRNEQYHSRAISGEMNLRDRFPEY